MRNNFLFVMFLFLGGGGLLAQGVAPDSAQIITPADSSATTVLSDSTVSKKEKKKEWFATTNSFNDSYDIEGPTIGLGTGLFSFNGDIYDKNYQSPFTSRIAFDLLVSQRLNKFLLVNFNVIFGKLGANERFTQDNNNANFESEIRTGGISIAYDFGNFLPDERDVTPFVSVGVEGFEFLSKTDMLDKNGNKYYYWSDGTIRNIDENASNAGSAVLLNRDYTYESDLRETNLSKYGKYSEYSFAIPIGAGVSFRINNNFNFRINTTIHLSFTDYIDGIARKNAGRNIKGKNDFFMMSAFGLTYNFKKNEPLPKVIEEEEINTDGVDFYALDVGDADLDGVVDFADMCQNTPAGVDVDSLGCPLDDDGDGFPNYRDKEINSPSDAIVDTKGVQLNDSLIALIYRRYTDASSDVVFTQEEMKAEKIIMASNLEPKEYVIDLGTYDKGLPTELLIQFLSIHDIKSVKLSETKSMYVAGKFQTIEEAQQRLQQLQSDGITNAKIAIKDKDGTYKNNNAPVVSSTVVAIQPPTIETKTTEAVVQDNRTVAIGTETKPISPENTITQEVSNTENTPLPATKVPEETTPIDTVSLAVVTPTEERPVIENKTATENSSTVETNNNTVETKPKPTLPPIPKQQPVVFRVQLGAYSKPLSKEVFLGIENVEMQTEGGLYKYVSKAFTSMEEASKFRVEMLIRGYEGAFISAYQDGKRVSLKSAGATQSNANVPIVETSDTAKINVIDKNLISFKVQVGIFKDLPPPDKAKILNQIPDVKVELTVTGLKRYVVGEFTDYVKAEKFRYDLIKRYNVAEPFVIAQFNNEYISVPEAIELLK